MPKLRKKLKLFDQPSFWSGIELTHPDYAALVDPLCFAKRVKSKLNIKIFHTLFPTCRREGGRVKRRPGESNSCWLRLTLSCISLSNSVPTLYNPIHNQLQTHFLFRSLRILIHEWCLPALWVLAARSRRR